MVNRKEYTLMMLKKAMSDHNKEMRHKGLWKMTLEQLKTYIRSQRLEIVVMRGKNKDTTPYVILRNAKKKTDADEEAGRTDPATYTGVRQNWITRPAEYVDSRFRGDRRTGRARQYLMPQTAPEGVRGRPKGTKKKQGKGRQQ